MSAEADPAATATTTSTTNSDTPTLPAGLSDAEKEVYVSVEIEGLRPADLADHTEWTASTIRTILSRARRKA